ncbi:hypothetical protein A9Q99_06995 [Gammaproteobacteria bacterium 45_16_T64]|nr:hypothetical protein A9Q99_06995 [Gammaproteobacteria bacterium 45_16_T64]
MKLRTKLLLPTLSISCLLVLFIVVIAILGYRNLEIQTQARNDMAQASAALVIDGAVNSLSSIAQVISGKQNLVNSLELDNQFEVLDIIGAFSDHSGLDFVNVYDRYLTLFSRSDSPGDFGHLDELIPQLNIVMKSRVATFYMLPYLDKLTLLHIVPLESINGFSGVLVVGRFVNASFLHVKQGEQTFDMQVVYGNVPFEVGLEGDAYLKVDVIEDLVVSGVSFYVKVSDTDERADIFTAFAVMLILVVIASSLILFHSYRSLDHISDRIVAVSKGVPLLAKGEFPSVSEDMLEGDEIGSMVLAIQDANGAIIDYTEKLNKALKDKIVANNQLERAKNSAVEMAIAKSQFLSNMSHEIRTPMNGVLGLIELIDASVLSDEDKGLVKTAKQSGKDLIRIINDILIFSKLDVGKDELELRPFCLKDELERDVQLLTPSFKEKKIFFSVQLDIDEECRWLCGDSTRLGQVTKNLLGNALKFSLEGGIVHYQVVCRAIDDAHAQLDVNVIDEGVGIDEDQLDTIFDSFRQADGSVTRRFGGTGLGLAICQKLVELMGGEIGVESVINQGSRFYFSIPILIASEQNKEAGSGVEEVKITSRYFDQADDCHLLLVEDNQVNVIVARGMLKKMGLRIDVATNGEEALDALKKKNYRLIFMDCQMPVMDGYQATKQIRLDGNDIPIVAMTANAMPGDREKCLAAGMNDYITKPLAVPKVSEALEQWLDYKRGESASNVRPLQPKDKSAGR